MGIVLPYFNLYCRHLGFSGFQIGILSFVRTLSALAFPLLWSALADRYGIRRPIYILCNFMGTGIWTFYLFTENFTGMLLISILYSVFYTPVISFLEAFTMDLLGDRRKSYGNIRVWGSINFILVVVILGRVMDHYPSRIILTLVLAGSLAQALTSLALPRYQKKEIKTTGSKKRNFITPSVGIFLFSFFLMLASHGAYYGFFSIHLSELGYGNTFIGAAWALASIAEIAVMVKSRTIFNILSVEKVMVLSFGAAALRWFTLFLTVSPAMILLSQALHAFTYGTFHIACILYVDRETTPENKTFGQSVNNAVTYGLGMAVGLLFSGMFYERLGSGLFLISGFIAVSGGLLLWGWTNRKNLVR